MVDRLNNLLADLPAAMPVDPVAMPEELVDVLATGRSIRIERIVSAGHASAEGFWYDQEEAEFVLILSGAAHLLLEGDDQPTVMKPGDWLTIPPHRRHRVAWTSPDEPTVWLAVFFRPEERPCTPDDRLSE